MSVLQGTGNSLYWAAMGGWRRGTEGGLAGWSLDVEGEGTAQQHPKTVAGAVSGGEREGEGDCRPEGAASRERPSRFAGWGWGQLEMAADPQMREA